MRAGRCNIDVKVLIPNVAEQLMKSCFVLFFTLVTLKNSLTALSLLYYCSNSMICIDGASKIVGEKQRRTLERFGAVKCESPS